MSFSADPWEDFAPGKVTRKRVPKMVNAYEEMINKISKSSAQRVHGPPPDQLTTSAVRLDANGKPIEGGYLIGKDGKPILGPDGNPIYVTPAMRVGPDGILYDGNGNPILGPDGRPLHVSAVKVGPDGNPIFGTVSAPPGRKFHQCGKCGQNLAGDYLAAMGKYWHFKCFVCSECGRQLREDSDFYADHANGKPYCPVCSAKKFVCCRCGEGILGMYINFSDGRIAHQNCGNMACPTCGELVEGKQIEALGSLWHFDCFKCIECSKILGGGQFMRFKDKPYCVPCIERLQNSSNVVTNLAGTSCMVCNQGMSGTQYISFGSNNCHEKCFKCSQCSAGLDVNKFYNAKGKLYCASCAN